MRFVRRIISYYFAAVRRLPNACQQTLMCSGDSKFLWRTESIRATVSRNDEFLPTGQFLNLDQELLPGESGWTNMKIDLPEYWRVNSVDVQDGRVVLVLSDGARYILSPDNVGDLTFEILDGGPGKSSEILERLWNRYARD